MTTTHEEEPGDDGFRRTPATAHNPARARRIRAVAGVAGIAAILGTASYMTTTWIVDDKTTETRDVAAVAPAAMTSASASATPSGVAPSGSGSPSSEKNADAAGGPEGVKSPSPSPSVSPSKSVAEQIKEARAAAAKDGYPLQRPLVQAPNLPAGPVEVIREGSLKEGGTMRIITAKHDLSGQRELLWAADDGERVGKARCTQNFHFSNNRVAKIRPTMLMCWRTSEQKSVVTIAVAKEGRPSKSEAVKELSTRWRTFD